MPRKVKFSQLTSQELLELATGFSISPDGFIHTMPEMKKLWRDHKAEIREYANRNYPERPIWIEGS